MIALQPLQDVLKYRRAVEGGFLIGDKGQANMISFVADFFNAQSKCCNADAHKGQQLRCFFGQRPETIDQVLFKGFSRFFFLYVVEFAVEFHALGGIGDVGFRETYIQVGVDQAVAYEAQVFRHLGGLLGTHLQVGEFGLA